MPIIETTFLTESDIKSLFIEIQFEDIELNIHEFFQQIDFKSFKELSNVRLENQGINDEVISFSGTYRTSIADFPFKHQEIHSPSFIIQLSKDKLAFIPMLGKNNYKEIIEEMRDLSENLAINLSKFFQDELTLNYKTRLLFYNSKEEHIQSIVKFFKTISTKFQSINNLHGRVDGISLEISKNDAVFKINLNKKEAIPYHYRPFRRDNKQRQESGISVGLSHEEKRRIKFSDLILTNNVCDIILELNSILNSLLN